MGLRSIFAGKLTGQVLAAFSWILLFCIAMNAQQPPESVMIDDLLGSTCEYQRAQIDNLLVAIKDSPEYVGLIIIHGEHNNPMIAYMQKTTITNHLRYRRFDLDRIVIQLGKNESKFRTELWKVPESELHRFTSNAWNFKVSDLTNAVLVHLESWTDGIGCWYVFDLRFYSEFLDANSDSIARVIIRDKSIARFSKIKTRITNELVRTHNISKEKLEFAFIQGERSEIEYWYIPSNVFR